MGYETLDDIRRKAREVWSKRDERPTSYQGHYVEKLKDVDSLLTLRPKSEHRRNRPHPSISFMTCRLDSLPGYFDPNRTWSNYVYQVDGSVGPSAQLQRDSLRSKFTTRPASAALRQYSGDERFEYLPNAHRQAAIAWGKINSDTIRGQDLYKALDNYTGDGRNQRQAWEDKDEIISLRGYMKMAQDSGSRVPTPQKRQERMTVGQRKTEDIRKVALSSPVPIKSTKGQFLLDPQWPPSFKHHRLNGLQSPWPV